MKGDAATHLAWPWSRACKWLGHLGANAAFSCFFLVSVKMERIHILGNNNFIHSRKRSTITVGICGRGLALRFLATSAVLTFQRCSIWIWPEPSLDLLPCPLVFLRPFWPLESIFTHTLRMTNQLSRETCIGCPLILQTLILWIFSHTLCLPFSMVTHIPETTWIGPF